MEIQMVSEQEQEYQDWKLHYAHVHKCITCGRIYGSDCKRDNHICWKCSNDLKGGIE